jgi:predicted phage terminase large subunit-like protein
MERLADLPPELRAEALADIPESQVDALMWDWRAWGRKNQIAPPGDWLTWLILAGRGFGKTRTGAEWVRECMCGTSPLARGRFRRMALVAETAADARDVMVQGPSGILRNHPNDFRPRYVPSNRCLIWPNGAMAFTYNAREPDQLRGPEHDAAWCDELAKFRYAQETWDQLQFGLRAGEPQQIITTTPRPIPLLKEIMSDPSTVITRGNTQENRSNLADKFIKTVIRKYEGTRLGRQELAGEILDDIPGALWTRKMLDDCRVGVGGRRLPEMRRVVVAVDPSGTQGEQSGSDDAIGDDVGIVVAGLGVDGDGYLLDDRSINVSPAQWAREVVRAYSAHGANLIVAEKNFGGAMVESTIRTADKRVPIKLVTASRGKVARAEPVSALYEQKRIHHDGTFAELEDQLVLFRPEGYMGPGSPDRADALIWAITELFFENASSYTLRNL